MSSNSNVNVASVAGSSRPRSMLGFVRKSTNYPSNGITNAETAEPSQTVLALPSLPPPTYAAYHQPHNSPNILDDFFGAGPTVTHATLRQDTPISVLPPYAPYGHEVIEREPGVYTVEQPRTLARMLFFYGFLFFPFWLAGIYILVSPLMPTPDWEAGKTEDEKTRLLQILRDTEKKWARRCLYAMFGLITAVFLLVVVIKFGIMGSI